MASWIKTEDPVTGVIEFTPPQEEVNHMPEGVTKITFDPNAPDSERWTAKLSYMYSPNETLQNVEDSLSGDFSWQQLENE